MEKGTFGNPKKFKALIVIMDELNALDKKNRNKICSKIELFNSFISQIKKLDFIDKKLYFYIIKNIIDDFKNNRNNFRKSYGENLETHLQCFFAAKCRNLLRKKSKTNYTLIVKDNVYPGQSKYYTILYGVINPLIDEKLAIGFMLFDNKTRIIKISDCKVNFIRNLISKNSFNLLLDSINSCLSYDSPITNSYIDYLHNYNRNVFHFGKALKIDVDIDVKSFDRLFKKFIGK